MPPTIRNDLRYSSIFSFPAPGMGASNEAERTFRSEISAPIADKNSAKENGYTLISKVLPVNSVARSELNRNAFEPVI